MPSTTDRSTARPDTRDMVLVHNTFRRCLRDLPDLIRGVAAGDGERAAVLAGFYAELATGVHNHHTHEDEYLWPLLSPRAGSERALVERGEEQHERVAGLLAAARPAGTAFRAHPTADNRTAFAETVEELGAALDEHMTDEERHVLPLVEEHLTAAEYAVLGEMGRNSLPKNRLLFQLGLLMDGLSAPDGAVFYGELPLPARVAWKVVGRRRYRKEIDRIYGR